MRVHMPITLSRLSLYKEDTTGNSLYKTETWIVDLPHARWQPCHRAILGCLYVAIKIYYITYGLKIIVWEGIVDGAHIDWLLHNRLCNTIKYDRILLPNQFGNPVNGTIVNAWKIMSATHAKSPLIIMKWRYSMLKLEVQSLTWIWAKLKVN